MGIFVGLPSRPSRAVSANIVDASGAASRAALLRGSGSLKSSRCATESAW